VGIASSLEAPDDLSSAGADQSPAR
jgi:hypothetical protein